MLKKPVVTEVRTPTNTWSGLGFSKSMPAETIKELRRANHVSYKPSMSTTYEVRQKWKCLTFIIVINMFNILACTDVVYIIRNIICLTVVLVDRRLCSVLGCTEFSLNLFLFGPQGSPLSLSRSSSREGVGNGSDSDNWRERNATSNGLASHTEFTSAVSSPKRKQNKSGQ